MIGKNFYSHKILEESELMQIANAWNREKGDWKSIAYVVSSILPNCKYIKSAKFDVFKIFNE